MSIWEVRIRKHMTPRSVKAETFIEAVEAARQLVIAEGIDPKEIVAVNYLAF